MKFRRFAFISLLMLLPLASRAADLSTAPSDKLLDVYKQLRSLQGSQQGATVENLVFKRDAATFTFENGKMTFAAPVEGHVVAAVFSGKGTFELDPPTAVERLQISRFSGGPKLVDSFKQVVFFFTDDSFQQLQSQIKMQSDADAVEAGKAIAAAEEKYQESFNDWPQNQRNGNPQMRNLAARMLSDLTDPDSKGLFLADFKGDRAGDLLFQISWNRPNLLLPEVNNGDEVMLLHINRNQFYEWWAGFHLAGEYAKSPHPDHRTLVAHCSQETVNLDLSKGNDISASADMQFEVNEGAPRLLPFNLQGVLRISDVVDGAGNKLAFIQEDRKLDGDPWLILPQAAKQGAPYQIKVSYQEDSSHDSRSIMQKGAGLYYVGDRQSWFPSFGAFDDRTNFVMNVQSPKKFTFVATGEQVKKEKDKDLLETQWKSDIPLGVIGFNYGDFVDKSHSDHELTVTAYAGREVPDELKGYKNSMALAQLERRSQPSFTGGSGDAANQLGVMTGGFSTAANAQFAADISLQALKFYEYCFGPLPFKQISVTEQPIRGYGQSWPYLIFLPYDSLLDSATRNNLGLQDTAEAREFYNIVAVHEMAHQWWGHVVGWKTYRDQWLSEGFAEFSASLYLRQFEPKELDNFWELKRKWLLSKDTQGHRPVDVGPVWLGVQLPAYLEENLYRTLVYDKGAYILEMLRSIMYNQELKDPNQPFLAMMKDFVTTYAGKNASTEDFQRIVEKHTGQRMDWFFNEWVYGTEIPHYTYKYDLRNVGGGKTELSLTVTQSGVSKDFQMGVPIDVYYKGQPQQIGMATLKGSETINGKIELAFKPEKVELNAEKSILCTIDH